MQGIINGHPGQQSAVDNSDTIRHLINMTQKKIDEVMFSPEELEKKGSLGVSARQIRRLCLNKELTAIDVGTGSRRWWKISASAVQDFLNKRGVKR